MTDVFAPVPVTKPAKSLGGAQLIAQLPPVPQEQPSAPARPVDNPPLPTAATTATPPVPPGESIPVPPANPVVPVPAVEPAHKPLEIGISTEQRSPTATDPGHVSTAVEVDPNAAGYGEGVLGGINRALQFGDNLLPGALFSIFKQDPRYIQSALAGNAIDFNADMDENLAGQNQFLADQHWNPYLTGILQGINSGGAFLAKPVVQGVTQYGTQAVIGGTAGAVVGGLIGGPVGAVAGASAGIALSTGATLEQQVIKPLAEQGGKLAYGLAKGLGLEGVVDNIGTGLAKGFGVFTHPQVAADKEVIRDAERTIEARTQAVLNNFKLKQVDTSNHIQDTLMSQYKIPAVDAQKLAQQLFDIRLGSVDMLQAQYYPQAYGVSAQQIQQHLLEQQNQLITALKSHGVSDADIADLGGKASYVVSRFEKEMHKLSKEIEKSPNGLKLTAEQVYTRETTKQNYRLVGDFVSTVGNIAKGANPELAAEALALQQRLPGMTTEDIGKASAALVGRLSPAQQESLIRSGAMARMPLISNELVDKATANILKLDPRVKVDPKVLEFADKQLQEFKVNPRVSAERSYQAMVRELQTSSLGKNLIPQGIKGGWASSMPKEGYVALSSKAVQALGGGGQGVYFDKQAAAYLENFTEKYRTPEKLSKWLETYDGLIASWTSGILSRPTTVFNNLVGNGFQYDLARGNPLKLKEATDLLKQLYKDPERFYNTPVGKELLDQGIIGQQTMQELIAKRGNRDGTLAKLNYYLNPLGTGGLKGSAGLVPKGIADSANALSTGVDEMFRVGLYLTNKDKGLLAQDARKHVMKFYYNGSDLSDYTTFEREWIRRSVPFYSWMKNNLPGQITNLVRNPFAAGRQIRLAHDWMQPKAEDSGDTSTARGSNFIPIADLVHLYEGIEQTVQGASTGDIGDVTQGLGKALGLGPTQGVTPFISTGVKIAGDISKMQQTDKYGNKKKVKPKNLLGVDVPPVGNTLAQAIPGISDLDAILKGAGIAGKGPVKQGIYTPDTQAQAGLFGTPSAEEYKTSRQDLVQFLGVPSRQLGTLADFNKLEPKARQTWMKAYASRITQLGKQGETELAGKLSNFYEKLQGLNIAQQKKEEATKNNRTQTIGPDGKPLASPAMKSADKQLKSSNRAVEAEQRAEGHKPARNAPKSKKSADGYDTEKYD